MYIVSKPLTCIHYAYMYIILIIGFFYFFIHINFFYNLEIFKAMVYKTKPKFDAIYIHYILLYIYT
jgi:hypothetical protein